MRLHESAWLGRFDVSGRQVQLARPHIIGSARHPMLGATFDSLSQELRRRGPILPIQIGLPQSAAAQNPDAVMEEVQALVDTGASMTVINISTAARLGLLATGSVQVAGVTGQSTQPIFGARIVMPQPGYTFDPIEIAGAPLSAPDFEVLIGRNLLCSMVMTYNGSRGEFTLVK